MKKKMLQYIFLIMKIAIKFYSHKLMNNKYQNKYKLKTNKVLQQRFLQSIINFSPDVQPSMDITRCRPLHRRAPLQHQLTNQRRVLRSRDEISANHSSPAGWRPWRPAAARRARTRHLQPRNEAGTSETGALSSTGKHQKI